MLITSAATGLQWLLWPIVDPAPFILYYPAVILAALYGDGVVAILLSALVAQFLFVEPRYSFSIDWPEGVVRQALFLVSAFMIRQLTRALAKALAESREAQSWLSTTLNSIGDAVIATDREGRVTFMNPVAESLTEWSLSEAKGRPLTEVFRIVNQQTRQAMDNPVTKVFEKGGIVGLANHTVVIGRNGKEAAIEDSAAPIRASTNSPIQGVVLVFRDITEKYSQDERLADAFKQLQLSEARVRSILDNALDAVVGMDAEGRITHWNPQAERIFGIGHDEALGRLMSETIIPRQYREAHERGMRHYLETGEGPVLNRRFEITALRRDGTEFPIELAITPIRIASLIFFAAFIRDITEQKRIARDLLLKSEALENSLNAFDIVSAKGEFVYANRAYLEMWGYDSLDEIVGTSPVSHCADPSVPVKIIGELKERGECEIEFTARRKDGSTFEVRMWARLAQDAEGREIYPTTAIDITEQKRAAEALKEAIRARDEFISICSHELKTPITSMKLQFQLAERLLKNGDKKVFQEDLVEKRVTTANRQLNRMASLIEEMLDVSRISAGRLELSLEPLDLAELVREVMDRFSEQFSILGVPAEFEAPFGSVTVVGDRYRLEQVLSNLLTNAMKYGSGSPIRVSLAGHGKSARLSVGDNGQGIPKESLERIFKQYERATSSSSVSGLGLGLYITRQIVERHRGAIWAESELGKGTTFIVELPLTQDPSPPASPSRPA